MSQPITPLEAAKHFRISIDGGEVQDLRLTALKDLFALQNAITAMIEWRESVVFAVQEIAPGGSSPVQKKGK